MELITEEQRKKMLENGEKTKANHTGNHWPVVKLFTPDANCTWLLSELDPDDPDDPDIAFGLCDLGLGFPELGYVSITELKHVRGKLGLPVERDLHFTPSKSLESYAEATNQPRSITQGEKSFQASDLSEEFIDRADSIFSHCGDLVHYSSVLHYQIEETGWPTHGLSADEYKKQAKETEDHAREEVLKMNLAQLIVTIKVLAEALYEMHTESLRKELSLDK